MEITLRKQLIFEKSLLISEIKDNPESIKIYGKNENIDDLIDSIKQIGFDTDHPIILNDTNTIISGHRRVHAALKVGLKEVPVKIYKYANELVELQELLNENIYRIKSDTIRYREIGLQKELIRQQAERNQIIGVKLGGKIGGGDHKSIKYQNLKKDITQVSFNTQQDIDENQLVITSDNKLISKNESPQDITIQIPNKINTQKEIANVLNMSTGKLAYMDIGMNRVKELEERGQIEHAQVLETLINKNAKVAANIVKNKNDDELLKPEIKELIYKDTITGTKIQILVDISRNKNIEIKELIPLPPEEFSVILADPPWRYSLNETTRQIENKYPTMSTKDICKLSVPTAKDCILFLWATTGKLPDAFEVMKSWGFEYKSSAIWNKMIIGMGYYFRGQHEFLLVGRKGDPGIPLSENRFSSIFEEKRTEHSKKPEIVYTMIEKMYPNGKYLEMFARKKHSDKWVSWGNEL